MKLYEMPKTVVHLKSEEEYGEYNKMRLDAGWNKCLFSWKMMKEDNLCHAIGNISNSINIDIVKKYSYKILTFPELKALLEDKKSPKPKATKRREPRSRDEIRNDLLALELENIKLPEKYLSSRMTQKPTAKKPKYFLEVRCCSILLVGKNGFSMSTRFRKYKSIRVANQQAKRLAAALGIEVREAK